MTKKIFLLFYFQTVLYQNRVKKPYKNRLRCTQMLPKDPEQLSQNGLPGTVFEFAQ